MRNVYPLLFVYAPLICASTLNLDFTQFGTGGYSQPVAGFSDSPFWWVDNRGILSAEDLYNDYGYDLGGNRPFLHGSLLLSNVFGLVDGENLAVTYSFLSQEKPGYDSGFALLLRDSEPIATLAYINTAYPLRASAGVRLSPKNAEFQGNMVSLGGLQYGPTLFPAGPFTLPGGSTNWVTSFYAPGTGKYQLLIGAWETIAPGGGSVALAVRDVTASTPEPGDLVLALTGLAVLRLLYVRHCHQRGSS